jgi:hypothetical protein
MSANIPIIPINPIIPITLLRPWGSTARFGQ